MPCCSAIWWIAPNNALDKSRLTLPVNRTLVMGVVNVTPDSFSGDGITAGPEAIVRYGRTLAEQGADLLDVGGESTRPGYVPVPLDEEFRRTIPAIAALAGAVDVPLSVDTTKADVASHAVARGAMMINDVSGKVDRQMLEVAARTGAYLVLVHATRHEPGTDLVAALIRNLDARIGEAVEAGVEEQRIVVDPGLGFAKGWRENFEVLRRLAELRSLGRPILVGPSRKGMIGRVLGVDVRDRMEGTLALVTLAIAGGADIVRVHDVREMVRAARMTDAIVRGE